MKFTLTIEMGNDAMRTRAHLAKALAEASKEVRKSPATVKNEARIIRDINGNTVGKWEFIDE